MKTTAKYFQLIITFALIIRMNRTNPIQKFDKDAILKSLHTRDRTTSTELLTDKNDGSSGNKIPTNKPKPDTRLSGLDIDAILNRIKEQKSGNYSDNNDEEREVVVVASAPERPQHDNANNNNSDPIMDGDNRTISAASVSEATRNAFLRQQIESLINRKRDRASRRRHVIETILVNLSQNLSSTSAPTIADQ